MDMNSNVVYLSNKNKIKQAVDENDIGIELSIFPGFSVPSAYESKEVNEISLYVIRMAVAMTCIQVGLSILTMLTLKTAAIVLSLLSIVFYLLVLRYAIRTVKKMNKETLCFGVTNVTSVKMYFYYLIFTFAIIIFGVIRLAFWIKYHSRKPDVLGDNTFADGSGHAGGKGSVADFWLMASIYMGSYLVLSVLNLLSLILTYQLNEILKRQLQSEELALGVDAGTKLTIFPFFAVKSSYDHPKVNRLMTTQLRIAFVFSFIQIVIAIVGGVSFQPIDAVLSTVNVFFYLMSLRYAIRCVKKMNKLAWCFFIVQVTSIKMYAYYLYLSFLFTIFGFVRVILWIRSHASYSKYNDSKFAKESGPAGGTNSYNEFVAIAVMYCIIYSMFLIVNLYQMYVAHVINKILAQEYRDQEALLGHVLGDKLTIVPGFAITSGYSNIEVNTVGQVVIRMSFWMCLAQIGMAVFEGISEYTLDIMLSLFNIVFYLASLRYAIRVIQKKNKEVNFCGHTTSSMKTYLCLLFISLIMTIVGFIRVINWVAQNTSYKRYNDSKFSGSIGGRGGEDSESEFTILASVW
eukprot:CAMPEP_0114475094 /NCGR_PEP_ID=MMETSP0104-20121206/13946_1 /TAXON_ID=37642 ORGANISM="Paraphysomonas imperforata, Strain PA2" /NCGR_SAMPLE_ID=MMETSP0104 /ASSEMBLY_ACC=CAM_ASM_000202 /LENGTH=573 /DNA_ID=CAMNT_0001649551 /DNA_START=19 /DNA_END=1737 /DNA_ORIENTATION=+